MKCRFCSSANISQLKEVDGLQIYKCTRCGIGFIKKEERSNKEFDYLYDFGEYRKQEQFIIQRLKQLIEPIVRIRNSGSILEIGSGYGLFSSLLLKKGDFTLDVVEPSLVPEYLKNTKYILNRKSLDQFLKLNKKRYDIIIMLDVIEHLEDPFDSLSKLKRILNDKGILIVQTPNYHSLMQNIVKNWSWWMVEDHKWFFSAKSMENTLKLNGFKIRYFKTYEDWIDFKKNLDGNFTQIKSPIIRKFMKGTYLSLFFSFYFLFRRLVWKMGYGGLIFAISQKG